MRTGPAMCPRPHKNSVIIHPYPASRTEVELTSSGMIRQAAVICLAATTLAQSPGGLRVVVLEGNGAINNIAAQKAHDPVVKVVDNAGAPVANAIVTFTLPASGPSGAFVDGQKSATVRTGSDGVAAARGLKPNKTPGQFEIRVTASAGRETARASVMETNALSAGEKSHSKKYVIIGVIAAGAAGGAIAAAMGGKGSTAAPAAASSAGGSVTPGAPTFGPPR